jgi:hypothetical protein
MYRKILWLLLLFFVLLFGYSLYSTIVVQNKEIHNGPYQSGLEY